MRMNIRSPIGPRKATNLSIRRDLLEEARALGINLSRACEAGLQSEIASFKARKWREENAESLDSSNDYVERHGLPLARFRQF
jgi:antitoxin CcdA